MTNEEKILAMLEKQGKVLEKHGEMLEKLTGDVTEIKERLSTVEADVSGLKSDVSELKSDVSGLKTDVSKMEIILEKVIEPKIQILAECQTTLLQKMVPVSRVQALEDELRNRELVEKLMDILHVRGRV